MAKHKADRDADAGFFEDWNESLDGLPICPRDPADRPDSPPPGGWSYYNVRPRPESGYYRLNLPSSTTIHDIARAFARPVYPNPGKPLDLGWWEVPAHRWRDLRAAMPELRRLTLAWERAREEERARADLLMPRFTPPEAFAEIIKTAFLVNLETALASWATQLGADRSSPAARREEAALHRWLESKSDPWWWINECRDGNGIVIEPPFMRHWLRKHIAEIQKMAADSAEVS